MGSPRGARAPSTRAYYVALAGVLALLLLLCCYVLYFCIRRIKEISRQGLPEPVASVRPPPKPPTYPIQPDVRESATAMARLCQLPPRADCVFPTTPPAPAALPPPRIISRPLSPAKSVTAPTTNTTTASQEVQ